MTTKLDTATTVIESLPDPRDWERSARIKAERERDQERSARIEAENRAAQAEAEIARLRDRLRRSSQG